MNPIELGKFIANLRNEKKLTQEELADKLFIDKRKISRWECGMSVPDFDMLIKLSEILDVSLYELSIGRRIEKEKLTRKAINKFKSIKDFKKYQLKQKLKVILIILLGILFLFTAIYTLKYYDTISIYEIESDDDKYTLKGTFILSNDKIIYNINNISLRDKYLSPIDDLDNCELSIYTNKDRIINYAKSDKLTKTIYDTKIFDNNNHNAVNYKLVNDLIKNNELFLKITCVVKNNKEQNYSIKLRFIKIYDNKLF